MEESFKRQMRKKVLDLKTDFTGFYTETYNLVAVLLKLNPDDKLEPVRNKMLMLYRKPSSVHKLSLPQLELLWFKFKDESNVNIRGAYLDLNEVKTILDKVRRDLLFYLALIEDRPKDYGIVLEKESKNDL